MKILSLSTVQLSPYLGSGKTRLMWTQGLRELGHEVTVLQPSDFEFLEIAKIATQIRIALGIFFKVNKILKDNHFDIVEFYGDQYWLLLLWIKKIKKIRHLIFIAHVDGIELNDMDKAQKYYEQRKGLRKWIYVNTHRRFSNITFTLADKYVCGCKDDFNYAIENNLFSINNAFQVSPGIDDSFLQMPFQKRKEKVIFFLGSWIKRKGINVIPTVISQILIKYPDYKFHVYGAWSSKNLILSSFSELARQNVRVFEKLDPTELKKEIAQCAIFFSPSYSEGFGLATVEAMSCSCAVVTTKTGVGSELVDNKEALLVNFDDIPGMVDAIDKLINNENFRLETACNGHLKAKEFQWSKQLMLLNQIYIDWFGNLKK